MERVDQSFGCHSRVMVVDDEELVHWGFRLLLAKQPWVERCLPATTIDAAVELAQRFEPHVALVDIGLLEGAGPQAQRRLVHAAPSMRVLLLTSGEVLARSTVRANGAAGYVSRTWGAGQLVDAVLRAAQGKPVMPRLADDVCALSARQSEILYLIASGKTNEEIADKLFLSRHTVKQHTSALYRKLEARNRTHAVQTAQRLGLIAAGAA